MKTQKEISKNGWYAVGGSIGVAVVSVVLIMITFNMYGSIFAVVAVAISFAALFCGSRKQRDGIFCGLFFSHILMFVLSLMYMNEIGVAVSAVLLVIGIAFDATYEGLGNKADKAKNQIN